MQNFNETNKAAAQPCRRRKAAGWRAFPNTKSVLSGFEGFVTKKNIAMKRNIFIICAVFALASCTKNFEEMNKDPFSPPETTIEALFNGVVGSLQQSMNEQFYLQNEIWYPETELGALTSESWGNSQIGTSELWTNYYLMLSNIRELERRFDVKLAVSGKTPLRRPR